MSPKQKGPGIPIEGRSLDGCSNNLTITYSHFDRAQF